MATYEDESFHWDWCGAARRRPRLVKADVIVKTTKTKRGSSITPLALVWGDRSSEDARIENTEAGHLVALSLGGEDRCENLVPMYGIVNRSKYRDMEISVAALAKKAPCSLRVQCRYPSLGVWYDRRIPYQIIIECFDKKTKTKLKKWEFSNEAGPALAIQIDPNEKQYIDKLISDYSKANWHVEQLGCDPKCLPPIAERKYEFLDFGNAKDYKLLEQTHYIGKGWVFTDAQIKLIRKVNQYLQSGAQKGELRTDAADDPVKSALTRYGTDNGAQIDHIHPKAQSGYNAFANAQVVSARFNRSKGTMTKKTN